MAAPVWEHALWYTTEYGLGVLPLREKLPVTAHGVKDASTDHDQLDRWAARWPAANLGIAGGGMARLVVLDFDAPDAEAVLTRRYGPRPATWTATTPRGGRHEYFSYPSTVTLGNTVSKLAPHVDTRATNGYVVAPPSTLADGRGYAWVDGRTPSDLERAPLPSPLLEALVETQPVNEAEFRLVPPRPAEDFDAVRVLDALRYLDADDFETWRDVGLALKASGHPAARGVWDAWSATSSKYDATVQQYQWQKMKPKAITIASIFYHATNAGWRPMGRAA